MFENIEKIGVDKGGSMPLDDEDKEYVKNILAESLKGVAKEFSTSQQKMYESMKSQMDQRFQDFTTPTAQEKEESQAKDSPPEDEKFTKHLEKIQKDLEQERQLRKEAEEASKRERLLTAAKEQLSRAGIPGDRLGHAMAYLNDSKQLFDFTEKGEPGMRVPNEWGDIQVVPVSNGVEQWVKSEEAQMYLPPVSAQGTGEHSKGSSAPRGQRGRMVTPGEFAGMLLTKAKSQTI